MSFIYMKKKFDWERFKTEKIAVHCKTKEEAKDFCREMHDYGMKWSNGDTYLEYTNYNEFKEKTCYSGIGCFCDYEHYKIEKYEILEWSDYMRKEFTKADLKDGMVVEYRDGERAIVLCGRVIGEGFLELECLNEDLLYGDKSENDIVKAFKSKNCETIEALFNDRCLELIWERNETKHMTAEEMRKKLEELTGEKIEVEPSREEMVGVLTKCCSEYDNCNLCCIRKECDKGGALDFWDYSTESLKQCYEKVIADGKK